MDVRDPIKTSIFLDAMKLMIQLNYFNFVTTFFVSNSLIFTAWSLFYRWFFLYMYTLTQILFFLTVEDLRVTFTLQIPSSCV
jgi:hypothetical protein